MELVDEIYTFGDFPCWKMGERSEITTSVNRTIHRFEQTRALTSYAIPSTTKILMIGSE
jgi:hypothetical protein